MSTWIALAKSGKLEMGDQVIGHTSTKQPIMAGRAAEHPGYSHWTTADHASAANVHATRARNLNIAAARSGGSMTLKRDAAASLHAATTHRQASLGQTTRLAASMAARRHDMDSVDLYWQALAKAGGAGSRGGNVIGHTKSGKPIYDSSHEHYAGLRHNKHGHSGPINGLHVQKQFPDYSAEDHHDALKEHQYQMRRASLAKQDAPAKSKQRRDAVRAYEKHENALIAHGEAQHNVLRQEGRHTSQQPSGEK